QHLLHLDLGHAAEEAVERDAMVRPVAPRVRVVGRPHDVVDVQPVPELDADRVDHERRPEVPVEDAARHLLHELDGAAEPAVAEEHVVELLEHGRDPADVPLDVDGRKERTSPLFAEDGPLRSSPTAALTPGVGPSVWPMSRPPPAAQKSASHSLYARTQASWSSRSSAYVRAPASVTLG